AWPAWARSSPSTRRTSGSRSPVALRTTARSARPSFAPRRPLVSRCASCGSRPRPWRRSSRAPRPRTENGPRDPPARDRPPRVGRLFAHPGGLGGAGAVSLLAGDRVLDVRPVLGAARRPAGRGDGVLLRRHHPLLARARPSGDGVADAARCRGAAHGHHRAAAHGAGLAGRGGAGQVAGGLRLLPGGLDADAALSALPRPGG